MFTLNSTAYRARVSRRELRAVRPLFGLLLLSQTLALAAPLPSTTGTASDASLEPAGRRQLSEILHASNEPLSALQLTRELSDRVGARLAGSKGAEHAVAWAVDAMQKAGLSNVRREPVRVPRWLRGEESAELVGEPPQPLRIATLGGSVGTRAAGSDAVTALEAEVVEVDSFEALAKLGERARGRIVLFNKEMVRSRDFQGYADVVGLRGRGAVRAAKLGAVAALIRSTGTGFHRQPHTGAMRYEDGTPRIPAAALAAEDAELLHRRLQSGETVRVRLRLGARLDGEVDSWNVVGEVPGRSQPEEIVLLGAHLDSWDLGTGALDDGAGCGIVLDTARRMAQVARRAPTQAPRRTVRVVLFMNEELGLSGARAYAETHRAELAKHVAAMEADSGAGAPFAYRVTGGAPAQNVVQSWLLPFGTLVPQEVGLTDEWGADLLPLQAANVPVIGVAQDVSDYFEWHHTAGDTFDKIRPRELAQAQAAFYALAHAAANAETRLPPSPKPPRF
jgi:hypothetical protein